MGTLLGRYGWSRKTDKDGYRDYSLLWLIKSDDTDDGPASIFATPGLPGVGFPWSFGNDLDPWAFCRPDWSISPAYVENEISDYWIIEQPYSNRPLGRCQDTQIDDPLDEPYLLDLNFSQYEINPDKDRFGNPIVSTSHEPVIVPFDDCRPSLVLGFNSLYVPFTAFSIVLPCVNDSDMWGFGPRQLKMKSMRATRKFYGVCNIYFTISIEIEVNRETWDGTFLSRGFFCLKGWSPGTEYKGDARLQPIENEGEVDEIRHYEDPANFELYKGINQESKSVLLNQYGQPVDYQFEAGDPEEAGFDRVVAEKAVEHYPPVNFFELGIPGTLEGLV